ALSLVATAIEKRLDQSSFPQIESAGPLWTVKLVAGDGESITADFFDVNLNLAGRLHGVGMEENVGFAGDFADLNDWLKYASFVVGHHYADQFCVGPECFAHVFRINNVLAVHRDKRHLAAQLLEMFAGIEHGMMFHGGGDYVIAAHGEAED